MPRYVEGSVRDQVTLLPADAGGVNYDVRSIGSVPVRGLQWRAERALAIEDPMSPADLAAWISIGTGYEPVS